jgi:hypothetical protein
MSQSLTPAPAPSPVDARADAGLLERLAGRCYRVFLDGTDRRREPRYVAIARTLEVRPYAVVTSDPAELLDALGCTDSAAAPLSARGNLP